MQISEFKQVTGAPRRYAVYLLEYLDTNKITIRIGDLRKFIMQSNSHLKLHNSTFQAGNNY
jgi:hypothetical protein